MELSQQSPVKAFDLGVSSSGTTADVEESQGYFFESNNSRCIYKTKQSHHPVQPSSICWHVKSPKNSRKKPSATLAISLKHGAIVPALSLSMSF